MSTISVSRDLNFLQGKIASSPAVKHTLKIQPHNASEFDLKTQTQVAQLNISTGQAGSFLSMAEQPVLLFKTRTQYSTAPGGAITWESSTSDIISRLVVRQANNILQDTQDYNRSVCLLSDVQGSPSNNGVIFGRSAVGSRTGGEIVDNSTTERVKEWALPLAGVLSGSTAKCLPLHAMGNAPITIEITFEKYTSATSSANTTNLTTFKVYDVYFTASQITFSPEVASVLDKQVGGKYLINTQSIQTFRNTIPASTTASTLIPVKVSYLKALMCAYYTAPDTSFVSRANPFVLGSGQYSWMIGGHQVPSAPVQVGEKCVEPQLELLKCLKNLSPFESNLLGDDFDATTFAIGVDLEKFSVSDSLLQGMDVYSVDTFLNQQGLTGSVSHTLITTALYDSVIEISNGSARLVF